MFNAVDAEGTAKSSVHLLESTNPGQGGHATRRRWKFKSTNVIDTSLVTEYFRRWLCVPLSVSRGGEMKMWRITAGGKVSFANSKNPSNPKWSQGGQNQERQKCIIINDQQHWHPTKKRSRSNIRRIYLCGSSWVDRFLQKPKGALLRRSWDYEVNDSTYIMWSCIQYHLLSSTLTRTPTTFE